MASFHPDLIFLSSGHCSMLTDHRNRHHATYEVPRTPRPRLLDLPPEFPPTNLNSTHHASHNSTPYPAFNPIFPVDLTCINLTYAQHAALWGITLSLPIHIHTPSEHIGTIRTEDLQARSSATLTAADVFVLLQSLACAPLELKPTFLGLPPTMQKMIHDAFYARTSGPGRPLHLAHCDATWSRFIHGYLDPVNVGLSVNNGYLSSGVGLPTDPLPHRGRPLGRDLLLGHCNIWGFESASLAGYDVVHLD
ncbi:hypothetical protein D9756_006852 [Leucocoprinus leucothites]|uniref:Uncharacterized protein n=1 Tax=Leucocoprinus leucothites TaxID=201217 RepID=A0A8H5G2R4_9AGAR|nr:hypothetical protein D9756_006852 [Leucoagaricus leucothites]